MSMTREQWNLARNILNEEVADIIQQSDAKGRSARAFFHPTDINPSGLLLIVRNGKDGQTLTQEEINTLDRRVSAAHITSDMQFRSESMPNAILFRFQKAGGPGKTYQKQSRATDRGTSKHSPLHPSNRPPAPKKKGKKNRKNKK